MDFPIRDSSMSPLHQLVGEEYARGPSDEAASEGGGGETAAAGAPQPAEGPLRFRKQALGQLSSPEQLERQLQVVGPTGWAIVGTLVFALVVALVWGFLGSIPTHVSGQGILRYQGGGVRQVVARGDGQLRSIEVSLGAAVLVG
jgi:hypothetical protein